jgi:hypothetical protein
MKRLFTSIFVLTAFVLVSGLFSQKAMAQQRPRTSQVITTAPVDAERIIRAFTAKETQFRQALNQYVFKRDAVIQTIGQGGQITGEYHRASTFVFADNGTRYEKINFFPAPTLTEVSFTNEDLEDLGGVQPFALEISKTNQYNFNYVGKEHLDELDTYVFDVAPKIMPNPKKVKERFFQGRIWVDDRDLQIVKTRGKGVPEGEQRFPTFETYREQIDRKYWFPTYTSADDVLDFPNGQSVHVRMLVRYTDFKQGRGILTVIDDDEPVPNPRSKPKP